MSNTSSRSRDYPPLARLDNARISPNPSRTVLRPFSPEDPRGFESDGHPRAERICKRILELAEDALTREVERTVDPLRMRHPDVERILLERCDEIAACLPPDAGRRKAQRLLIGAYFSEEYSFESAALFNPSVVAHPDQSESASDDVSFVLSLRGVGEGHLSSLTFRTGVWRADGSVEVDDASPHAVGPRIRQETLPNGRMLAHLDCGGASDISETVLYPFLPSQGRGIEDMRLVSFTDGDGMVSFRGTFTAFDGTDVRQGLIQTSDFKSFEMRGVEGDLYAGKGMALFDPSPIWWTPRVSS